MNKRMAAYYRKISKQIEYLFEVFPEATAVRAEELILSFKTRELPAETIPLEPKLVHWKTQLPAEHAVVEATVPTATLEVFTRLMSAFSLNVEVARVPEIVIVVVPTATPPAAGAEKVMVAMSSTGLFVRLEVAPRGVTATARTVRWTVIVFPFGLDKMFVVAALEPTPLAVITDDVAANSVEVAILNVLVELSAAAPEVKLATSPLRTRVTELDFGTITGFAKWNW